MVDASTARARTAPTARKTATAKTAAPRNAAKKAAPTTRAPRKAAARKTTARRPDLAPTEPTALAEAIAARQAQPGFDADALLANSTPAPRKKAVPRKAAAKKTAVKKAPPVARTAARKTSTNRTPRKAAAKKPARPSAAKAGTSRAKKAARIVRYARKHPIIASLGAVLVITTITWRGLKGGGRLIKNATVAAWAKGEDERLNRRAAKKAAADTAAGHKGCPACKGTGVLPKHNADGTWAGSVRCTPAAARRAARRRA